tara:strand:- start:41333 stop:42628 length:1296 start_codon:yes stop_codon:yes gene_type:complete
MKTSYSGAALSQCHRDLYEWRAQGCTSLALRDFICSTTPNTKLKREESGLPFSFIKLYAPNRPGYQIHLITHIRIGEPGGCGQNLMTYKLMVSDNHQAFRIFLNTPSLIKESRAPNLFNTDGTPRHPGQQMQTYMEQNRGGDFFSTRRPSKQAEYPFKFYYEMDFNDGEDLLEAVLDRTVGWDSLPPIFKAKVAYLIAWEVKRIHDKGYCHLDIKLENILIKFRRDTAGHIVDVEAIYLIDLDYIHNNGYKDKTLFGSPDYLADELWRQNTGISLITYNFHSDIFALGCTFWALFTESSYPANLLKTRDVAQERRKFFSSLPLTLMQSNLSTLFMQMVAVAPNCRPTIDLVIDSLAGYIEAQGASLPSNNQALVEHYSGRNAVFTMPLTPAAAQAMQDMPPIPRTPCKRRLEEAEIEEAVGTQRVKRKLVY